MIRHPHVATAEAYYQAFVDRDLARIASYVHQDVRFRNPSGETRGKDAFLAAARNLVEWIRGLDVRARFGSADQAMLAYDLHLKGVEQPLRAAVLMGFEGDLIASIELFFDPAPLGPR